MRKLGLFMSAFVVLLLTLPAAATNAAGEPKEKRELLANHETLAVFDGLEYHLCRGLTALCPKQCGDSGEIATFAIKKYLKYEKLGQYGDPEQKTFVVQVSDYDKKPKGDPKILETVNGLKKGDYVLLSWHHDYVTKEGTSSPERPIVKLEKLDGDKANELLNAPAAKGKKEATTKKTTTLDIKTQKSEDRVKATVEKDTGTFDVSSQSGIGGATITAAEGKWPTTVILRFHLRGLELFSISNDKITLKGSVLSHSGNPRLLDVVEDGKEKKVEKGSPYWTEIRGFDSKGKPVPGLPGSGGYFEITVPKALLEGQPKSLDLGWIDFYRR